jgi:hypothetical protein
LAARFVRPITLLLCLACRDGRRPDGVMCRLEGTADSLRRHLPQPEHANTAEQLAGVVDR